MTDRLVGVGGDAAEMSAASQAKRLAGDKLEVIAFERMLTDVEAIDLQAGTVAVG
jgi:hypothetical protein